MKNINTRFAPSPTGNLHIGNIRVAIYSWLFAKKNNGNFYLRIENTNENNSNDYVKNIINQLKWLGINWDKKIIYQSNRKKKYEKIIKYMIKNNKAYYCFCSKKRLEDIKKKQIYNKDKPKYDEFCKNIDKKIIKRYIKNNKKFVIRFNGKNNDFINFNDLLYGNIKFNNKELDDLIIKKSNGNFTYNFCVIIDDNKMNITHIIRGNDHISNTPRQINILKSLNYLIPKYIHIPIILNENKSKISKKNNNLNIDEFIKEGILPESIIHFITNPNFNKNILNIKEIINNFNIKNISKSSIIFDKKKLLYINKLYLSKLSKYKIKKRILYYINNIYKFSINICINKLLNIFKNRFKTFSELLYISKYIYDDVQIDIKKVHLYINKNNKLINFIKIFIEKIKNIKMWTIKNIKNILIKYINIENKDIKIKLYYIIRYLLSGFNNTPELYYIIYLIKKEKVIDRINLILKK